MTGTTVEKGVHEIAGRGVVTDYAEVCDDAWVYADALVGGRAGINNLHLK